MSVAVAIADLADTASRYGDAAYVLTVADDGRSKIAHVRVRIDDDRIHVRVGPGTAANARQRPQVVLLWPQVEPGGFSLIVDATCAPEDVDDDGAVRLRATSAVLHRPPPDS